MKRAAYIVAGALALLVLGTLFIRLLPSWALGAGSLQGEARANYLVGVLLGAWIGFLLVGGFIGNWLYLRNLTRRSTGRAKAARR